MRNEREKKALTRFDGLFLNVGREEIRDEWNDTADIHTRVQTRACGVLERCVLIIKG